MNFLSHYYFDRATTDPYRVMGGVLPDLVKNVRKDWTFHPDKRTIEGPSEELQSLLDGWRKHLEIDRHFHCSLFFMEHTSAIRTAVAPVLERSPVRPSFLAHIALELMLDGLLITQEIVDPDEFYAHLSRCKHGPLQEFLILNNADAPQLFFPFLEEFIHSKYLHNYREPEQIMYALNRICLRIWDEPLADTQKMQLTAILPDYQQKLKKVFMQIFDHIAELLAAPQGNLRG